MGQAPMPRLSGPGEGLVIQDLKPQVPQTSGLEVGSLDQWDQHHLLEMHPLRPHLRPPDSEAGTVFQQAFQGNPMLNTA